MLLISQINFQCDFSLSNSYIYKIEILNIGVQKVVFDVTCMVFMDVASVLKYEKIFDLLNLCICIYF